MENFKIDANFFYIAQIIKKHDNYYNVHACPYQSYAN